MRPYVYKMHTKLEKKKPFLMPFIPHAMLVHRWKNPSICWCNIRILLQLQGKTCLSNTDGDKGYPSLKPQLSQQPCEKD